MYAIQARDLSRLHGDTGIGIHDIQLSIAAGAFVILKGESGSGKSTLLSLLAGLDKPTTGELVVAGHNVGQLNEAGMTRFRRDIVGVVFQSFNLLPTLSVLENAALPGMLAGRKKTEVWDQATSLLVDLGMEHRLHQRTGALSGGEMQRCAIARALINKPSVLLADEPTGNLDSKNSRIVLELLANLRDDGTRTIVMATHSDMADDLADETIHMSDGYLTTSSLQ